MILNGDALVTQRHAFNDGSDAKETAFHQRIVALRKERGLTLQDCARMTGVAASTLSKIERAELSPTISTLQKIAAGFELDAADLLMHHRPTPGGPGRRAISRAGTGKAHQSMSCNNFLLCHELKNKRMIPIRTRVTARNTDEYPVWATADAEVFLWVVSGRMLLHTKIYEPTELGPGDAIYYDATGDHCWTSVGEEDAEVIWVMTA